MSRLAISLLGLALGALPGCDRAAPAAPVGEVRGASLLGFGRAPEADASAGEEPPVAAAEEEADPTLGEDYTDVLPAAEAAKYEWVDFLDLTDFELESFAPGPEGGWPPGLPEYVAELDGKLVAVEGFMNPTEFDRDGVSQFTLVADPTFCCFGMTPQLNHFIQVDMPEGEHTEFFSIVPIAVFGRLEVGLEEEDGIELWFYRMTADHVFCVY